MADPLVSASDTKTALPSELFRTIVSLLLFFHLFSVGLAMVTGSAAGSSALLSNAKMRTPGIERYLWQMWLDHGYDYELINFMPMFDDTASMEWPYHLEATLKYADGRPDEIVELPDLEVRPGEVAKQTAADASSDEVADQPEKTHWLNDRRERLQQLPRSLAGFSQWPEGPTINDIIKDRRHQIGGSIGAGLLREHPGAESATLRWYYHRSLTTAELRNPDPPTWSPTDPRYFVTVGRMVVSLVDNQPESMDILPQGEISPLKPQAPSGKAASPSRESAAALEALKPEAPPLPPKDAEKKMPVADAPKQDSSATKSKSESN